MADEGTLKLEDARVRALRAVGRGATATESGRNGGENESDIFHGMSSEEVEYMLRQAHHLADEEASCPQ